MLLGYLAGADEVCLHCPICCRHLQLFKGVSSAQGIQISSLSFSQDGQYTLSLDSQTKTLLKHEQLPDMKRQYNINESN